MCASILFANCRFLLLEDRSRAGGLFDRTLLMGMSMPSFLPPQTLIIVFFERDTLGMMMMIDINYYVYLRG